jgi:hypothetical protein
VESGATQHRGAAEFKRFLLEPRNLKSLQALLLYHVLPARLPSDSWPTASHLTLSGEEVELAAAADGAAGMRVGHAAVTRPDAVLRPDGVIHGIERLLVPRSVQEDFNRRRSLAAISAVLPTGAPEVNPRTHRLKKPAPPVPPGAPPVLPIWDAMAPGPSIADGKEREREKEERPAAAGDAEVGSMGPPGRRQGRRAAWGRGSPGGRLGKGRAPPISWAPRALWPRWMDGVGLPPNGAVTEVTARPYKGCNIKTGSKKEVSTLQGHRRERDLFQGLAGNFPIFY